MLRRLLDLGCDRRGIMLAEVAIALPLLAVLIFGTIEATNYAVLKQKLERAAVTVADLVSREEFLTGGIVTTSLDSVAHVVSPFAMGPNGVAIVSGISRNGTAPAKVNWQRTGGGTKAALSGVGLPGVNAVLPAGFVVRDGEGVIVVEIIYDFAPRWLPLLFPATTLSQRAMYRPRYSPTEALS
ncbi:MAG: hypothetical protein EXQ96_03260 [Alphaproteobacteria bacterium]|nr:hypothetical protein [Alphaproteobacteria bacterium]